MLRKRKKNYLQILETYICIQAVEAIVPPFFLEKRNRDVHKPRELFWMEHKRLLEESASHMKSTTEFCMLIATIILTVVFAAAFTPPGGYNQDTGIPILLKSKWFACFIIFEALGLFSSTYCIIGFWSIISSNYEEDQFLICSLALPEICPICYLALPLLRHLSVHVGILSGLRQEEDSAREIMHAFGLCVAHRGDFVSVL